MNYMYRTLTTIIATLWMLAASSAQQEPQPTASGHISSADGLSNDYVLSLAIDGQGYVWVATEAGVNRIAGQTCQPFPQSALVADQRITALHWHEPSALMLIGTRRGLTVFNPERGTTTEFTTRDGLIASTIDDIVTAGNDLWLVYGNGDVQRLETSHLKDSRPQTGGTAYNALQATRLDFPHQHRGNRCAMDDGRGNLYIGHSHDGLCVVRIDKGTSTNYRHQAGDDTSLPGNNVRQIIRDSQGRVWVGTDGGLARFNPERGTFEKVTHANDAFDDNVYDIYQTADGLIWVATDIGGIRVLDPRQAPADGRLHYTETTVGLSSRNTRAIVQDEFGNIWVGSHSTGVDFISARKSDFAQLDYRDADKTPLPVYAIASDLNGGFWMANERELTHWQPGRMTARWSAVSRTRRQYSQPRCMMNDSRGKLWVGIDDQGVYRFDPLTGKAESIDIVPEGSDIHFFTEDEQGRIWIGAEFGVYIYADGKATRHEAISRTIKAPATCIMPVAKDRLFIATLGDGIYTFDTTTGDSRHLSEADSLPSTKVNQVIRSIDGQGLWMATDGGLVYLEHPAELRGITTYGREQGLAEPHLQALRQSSDGRVWVSSYAGISCFDSNTATFYNYNHRDTRLTGGSTSGAVIAADDGTIYFGSAAGVSYFNPSRMDDQAQVSDVQIILCEAYNPVEDSPDKPNALFPCIPDENGHIRTDYHHNTLRLTFTVRDYAQTEQAVYSYMMKGMDNKWYDVGSDHDVVFRGLPPGHYTFILRAKLRHQDWNEAKDTRLEITITPPFWRTWWAYIAYLALLAVVVAFVVRHYKRRLARRSALELERRENIQKQQLNEERLRFFTNITHELRTPLTLILGPLEDLEDDRQLTTAIRRRVAMIRRNAEGLRNLISEILEFRKAETQNRRLTVARGDIAQLVREICLNFKELNSNPNVAFTYDIAPDLPKVYFDSEIVTIILNNYLSNAVKYTPQGSITTRVRATPQGTISIAVSDTGYGISPDAVGHIFERYYQAGGSHQASGTGIGLALVKALAELHEGSVGVESHEGQGSTFTFSLKADNTYPEALHKEDQENEELRMKNEESATALPTSAAAGPTSAAANSSLFTLQSSFSESQKPQLLVVEDNADIRQYISDTFSDDFTILEAADGEQGVQTALECTPDIIVSDIMMPKLNGIQLTRRLKADIRTSHIPIILLTAKTADEDKEQGYDSGADSYLTKPFTARLLASRIQNLLTARRRLAEHLTGRQAPPDKPYEQAPTLGRLDQEFLDKLNELIRANIMQADIDMAFLTDRMAMSHSTFYRKVKALTGLTAKEYVRKRRLQHCYQLIESGRYNVTEAAMMTGFNQMAHFREVFKREFGILPSEIKRN